MGNSEGKNVSNNPRKYNHPFEPYDIQIQLMDAIYDAIDNYKIGLFESPTGTGKTLSLICSSMTWLRQHKKNSTFHEAEESDSEDEPEWVKEAYQKTIANRSKIPAQEYETYLDGLLKNYDGSKVTELPEKRIKRHKSEQEQDESFVPADYYSDSELDSKYENDKLASEINELLSRVEGPKETIEPVNNCPVKIFFSSRTHSQLSQFSHQLNMTEFETSLDNIPERIKFSPLASRKQLCIHPKISRLSNVSSINDACIDLQQSTTNSCEYIPKLHNTQSEELVKKFSDLSFTKIHDIEDLGKLGNNLKICPYYSVRKGIDITEIIALPYQMLLQDSTRLALNLNLDDSIIIIDEAHNLLDVISSMYSVSITGNELSDITKSLKFYLNKFIKKLNSGNRINIMKLIKLCQVLDKFISSNSKDGKIKHGEEIIISDIFEGTTGDLVNIHKIEQFLNKSKIAYKIESYMEKVNESQSTRSKSNPLLFKITKFLKSLTNPSKEGKVFWDKNNGTVSINYMLLDPSEIFRDIVKRARCVLLCGGTMEPMNDYTDYLFPYVPSEQIKMFSCGHIIPLENLKVFPIGNYNNVSFEFLFDKRNNSKMLIELGNAILKITEVTPDGIVIFFPSYKYLNAVMNVWKQTKIIESISKLKVIFQEPEDSSKVETVLNDYSKVNKSENQGALLFSVVGGKMSEGINFSDELARAVIMIGLPFPNIFSAELIAKRKFIEESTIAKGGTKSQAMENAKNFYENICMRAVNQSIGRSIRHKNDYSVIYLFDQRYGLNKNQDKLSGWVKQKLFTRSRCTEFNQVVDETREFFRKKSLG
ncbi:unnamed protein product [Debaryomyces fabryi]|nr:unnamed protein product [Debaryomyces fabryi]